jgi:hypothetical protein
MVERFAAPLARLDRVQDPVGSYNGHISSRHGLLLEWSCGCQSHEVGDTAGGQAELAAAAAAMDGKEGPERVDVRLRQAGQAGGHTSQQPTRTRAEGLMEKNPC